MSTWEQRMSAAAKARQPAIEPQPGIPSVLHADPGDPAVVRCWCTECGLPDPPVGGWCEPNPPCPRCGSQWRWWGRISDLDGTATGPPDDGTCRECFEWRRYSASQAHFGWAWWRTCGPGLGAGPRCEHLHHQSEQWMA